MSDWYPVKELKVSKTKDEIIKELCDVVLSHSSNNLISVNKKDDFVIVEKLEYNRITGNRRKIPCCLYKDDVKLIISQNKELLNNLTSAYSLLFEDESVYFDV